MSEEKIMVLVSGCNGRMGKMVCNLIKESEGFALAGGYDLVNDQENHIYNDPSMLPVLVDVIIDFSSPEASMNMLSWAVEHKTPIVIATTGFSVVQEDVIREISKRIPVFRSPNMSYVVALLKQLLMKASPHLASDSDIEIFEIHHSRKKDSPSGTAEMLAKAINQSLGSNMDITYARGGKRRENEIGISSLRGGNVPGTHSVYFFGKNEDVCFTHQVHSPEIFAEGALRAAEFLCRQEPGFFTMDDLVSL